MKRIKHVDPCITLKIYQSRYKNLILYNFKNLMIISKPNTQICPNCIFFYCLGKDTYNLIEKTRNSKEISYPVVELKEILSVDEIIFLDKLLMQSSYCEDDDSLMMLDIDTKKVVQFSLSETYSHFMCPCETYIHTDFSKHVGRFSIIKETENMNHEISEYLKNSFFEDNYVYFTYFFNPLSLFNNFYHETDLGIGIDCDNDVAKTKSIMESIERYALFLPQSVTNNPEIDKNAFCLIKNDEKIFQTASSNGYAASPNVSMTILNACSEVLERDSLMHMWLFERSFYKLNKETLPNNFQIYIDQLRCDNYETFIYCLNKHPEIYCFVVLTINKSNEPFIKTGIGSDAKDKNKALNKAFGELLIGIYFDLRFAANNAKSGADFHLNYYRSHYESDEKLKNINFLLSSDAYINWDSIPHQSSNRKIKSIELVNSTPPKEVFNDVSVIKASQRGLLPIHFKGFSEIWGRMYFTAQELKILNEKLHPFP